MHLIIFSGLIPSDFHFEKHHDDILHLEDKFLFTFTDKFYSAEKKDVLGSTFPKVEGNLWLGIFSFHSADISTCVTTFTCDN